jgi:hypothetical protein
VLHGTSPRLVSVADAEDAAAHADSHAAWLRGRNTAYPVLYLFHGGGGDEEAWNELGAASTILDNLISRARRGR